MLLGMGKKKRSGVGGKASKSTNFKECKNANIRRNAKNEREATKDEERAKQKWIDEQNAHYAPVDKTDDKNNKKNQKKNDEVLAKLKKKQDKAERDLLEWYYLRTHKIYLINAL